MPKPDRTYSYGYPKKHREEHITISINPLPGVLIGLQGRGEYYSLIGNKDLNFGWNGLGMRSE